MFNYIFLNLLILCSVPLLLLWSLTNFFFYKTKFFNNQTKSSIFECGFISLNKSNINLVLNSFFSAIFFFFYEFEFLFILPLFSIHFFCFNSIYIYALFTFFILFLTLWLDIMKRTLQWVYKCLTKLLFI